MAGKKKPLIDGVDLSSASDVAQFIGRELVKSADTPNLLRYKPHPKQRVFHRANKKTRLYIGGNRSGKTTAGVVEDLWWANKRHPYMRLPIPDSVPCRGRVVAVDFVNGIDKIILPQFAQWTPKSMLVNGSWWDSYDKAHRVLNFANGSFIEFMSYDQDLDKFAGTSRHFVHFDEEPPQAIYNENRARLVDTGGYIWFTMTPVEGMTWVFDQIYEPGIMGHPRIEVIVVDMTDNPYLSRTEIEEFIDGLDEEEVAARIHGKFVQLGGLIYKRFDPKPGGLHVLNKERWIPDWNHWELHLSLDHGLNNPTAVGFHAVDTDGQIITFDEHYKSELTVPEHAIQIHKKLIAMDMPIERVASLTADPSINQRESNTGTSIQQEYAKHGIYWALGNNDVKSGIIRVKQFMQPHPKTGIPRWRITRNCVNHIKEHSRYRWKTYETKKKNYENNAYEEPHKYNDHSCDSLRYFLMSQPEPVFNKETLKELQRAGVLTASQATRGSGDLYPRDFDKDIMETDDGYAYAYSPGEGGGMHFDEHLGGLW